MVGINTYSLKYNNVSKSFEDIFTVSQGDAIANGTSLDTSISV